MLSKRFKILLALITFTAIVYVHLNANELLSDYKMTVATRLQQFLNGTHSPHKNNSVESLFLTWEDEDSGKSLEITTHPTEPIVKEQTAPPTAPTTYPKEPTTHPQESTTHPQESTTHPKTPTAHPKKPTTYPKETTIHPKKPTTHPKETTTQPKVPPTHPKEPTIHTIGPTDHSTNTTVLRYTKVQLSDAANSDPDPSWSPATQETAENFETPGGPGQVDFPSISNCTYSKRKRKGHTHTTKDVYPCRKWFAPDPNDPFWPVVLSPSYGKSLTSLARRQEDPQIEQLINEQLVEQTKRVNLLAQTCSKHPELSVRQYLRFVWDTSRTPPVIYCPIYKVASTTWMVYFLRLRHINDHVPELDHYDPHTREQRKYLPRYGGGHRRVFKEYIEPKESQEKKHVFQDAIRFIVVRHPFARLLSAFRDKIEREEPRPFTPYFKDLQQAIISKYRPRDSNITLATPTFSEFVYYIIDTTKNFKTAKDWDTNVVCWTPYWVQCGVCASDYQVIVKLETMATDEQFLAHIANLKEIQNVYEWRNLRNSPAESSATRSKYYRSLTKRQIWLLYQRYKLDFDLFGYSVDEYLDR